MGLAPLKNGGLDIRRQESHAAEIAVIGTLGNGGDFQHLGPADWLVRRGREQPVRRTQGLNQDLIRRRPVDARLTTFVGDPDLSPRIVEAARQGDPREGLIVKIVDDTLSGREPARQELKLGLRVGRPFEKGRSSDQQLDGGGLDFDPGHGRR